MVFNFKPNELEDIKNILSRNDYKLGKSIGKGSWGKVFNIEGNNDRVLKITGDKSEFETCTYLHDKKLKNVYHIYRVFKLKQYDSYYFIEQEKLKQMSSSELNGVVSFMEKHNFYDGISTKYFKDSDVLLDTNSNYIYDIINNKRLSNGKLNNNEDESSHDSLKELLDKYKMTYTSIITLPCFLFGLDWEDYSDDLLNENEQTVKYLEDIINGMIELADLGILFNDVHEGNLMKRGNNLVIIDLGQSKSPQVDKYDILENYYRLIIN